MKSYKTTILKLTLFFAVIMAVASCTNNKPEDPKEVAEESNEEKFNSKSTEKDAQFLVNVAEINMEEVSLGKLAQTKGNTDHVKELGKMMEDEHSKSLADLSELAKSKNITLPVSPTDDAKDAYKKLNDKSGNDFGKDYSDKVVKGHQDAIALFEKAANECTDPEIKAFAAASVPALKMHLDHAVTCQKKCEKM